MSWYGRLGVGPRACGRGHVPGSRRVGVFWPCRAWYQGPAWWDRL